MLKYFTSHLFYKIGLLVVFFSIFLTVVIFYTVDYYYVEPDTLLDAHELYFYGNIVDDWSFPRDSIKIKEEIDALRISVSFYSEDSSLVWFYPTIINPAGYLNYTDSNDMERLHGVKNPLFVSLGSSSSVDYLTYAKKDSFHVFVSVEQEVSPEYINYLPPILVSILFMVVFNFFIRRFFRPIAWMNQRVRALRAGDMKSKISIVSNDELSELSQSINKMIADIRILLSQKQQLLLDVSHELRSPLARMRLLVEMIPDHKNKGKMVEEIVFLEGMISNLLLSDKLSLPYSNLDYNSFTVQNLLHIVMDLVNVDLKRFDINSAVPDLKIVADKTKLIIALRNLIDNAIKYGDKNEKVKIEVFRRGLYCVFHIINVGEALSQKDVKKIFTPFYRSQEVKNSAVGFGLGLTIAQKIIMAHGGSLSVSTNNNEVKFSLEVPIEEKNNFKL